MTLAVDARDSLRFASADVERQADLPGLVGLDKHNAPG